MSIMKKAILFTLAMVMVISLAACGCTKKKEEEPQKIEEIISESQVTGGEVMNEIWNRDLVASAAFIDNFHCMEVEEVLNIWKQAHMQKTDLGTVNGNGALIYGICSPSLRPRCLEVIQEMNAATGCGWNFYLNPQTGMSDQSLVPQEMLFSEPEKYEEADKIRYFVEVNEINAQGEPVTYQLTIEYIDGGYYLAGRTAMATEEAVDNAEAGHEIGE